MIDSPNVVSSGARMSRRSRGSAAMLQDEAGHKHQRHGKRDENDGSMPKQLASSEDREGGQHDQIAMREIDEPHDAEDQRSPAANRA